VEYFITPFVQGKDPNKILQKGIFKQASNSYKVNINPIIPLDLNKKLDKR
jgi:hypothetical protein